MKMDRLNNMRLEMKMKCSQVYKLLSPYIDSELPEGEMRAIEDHLRICTGCRAEFGEMQSLSYLFANTNEFKAPYGFHTRVLANINTAVKAKGTSVIPIFARLAEAVIVILVIAIGITSGSFLTIDITPQKVGDAMASLSVDVFDPAPPGFVGGVYLAMTEEQK
jgi:predicted anti-sigma-YlaC factor YlaD